MMARPVMTRLAALLCVVFLLAQAVPAQSPGQGGVPGATPGTPGQIDPKGGGGQTQTQSTPSVPGQGGTPGATPGNPGQRDPKGGGGGGQPQGQPGGGKGDWTLSDLLDGILKMDQAGLRLSADQAAKIRPALQKVIEASTVISETEKSMRSVLTAEQLAYIEEAQRSGKLNSGLTGGKPSRPGEDPVVSYVIELLEKKAR